MRRKLVLGVGLAALVGGSAAGQFAVDRAPAAGAPPATLPGGLQPAPAPVLGGYQPLTPPAAPAVPASPGYTPTYSAPAARGAYVPPVDGLRSPTYGAPASTYGSPTPAPVPTFSAIPVNVEIPLALRKDHPWLLKPEHGPYFIMVKSYVRPAQGSKAEKEAQERGEKGLTARELAEGLASEIRDTYRVQAFLYEYISEERKAEERALIAARQKAATEYVGQLEALKQKAQLQGMDFINPDNKLRVRTHDHRDQIGVLVGGFQTEADALKALLQLKKWPTPKNEVLLDKGLILTTANGKQTSEAAAINPYAGAFVVPNPAIVKAVQPGGRAAGLEPFVVKLNEGRPHNLLKATKPWTLAVKSFTAPVEIVNKDSDTSLMRKMGMGKGTDALLAGELQAEALAKALRGMKGSGGQSLNLEAFVLHTRNASLVTVGQFDGPDDPALLATKRLLGGITANVSEDQAGLRKAMNVPSLFDNMVAMPVPKP
jgi:hypothetical protein